MFRRTCAGLAGLLVALPASAAAPNSTQYAEGSVTVKLAFTTADAASWPAMEGSLAWPAFIATNATTGRPDQPAVQDRHLMQVDVVVKDSQSAPQTGWVFTTLVYDRNAPRGRTGVWDQRWCSGCCRRGWRRPAATRMRSAGSMRPGRGGYSGIMQAG